MFRTSSSIKLAAHAIGSGLRPLCIVVVAAALTACGGGSKASASTPVDTSPPPPNNNAPAISGSPTVRTIQDKAYEFTPTASDADGDNLVFSIANQPTWASFDTATGTLSGTPSLIDIGKTLGVSISVSDDESSASMTPFDLEVLPTAFGSATISWDAPSTNADGSLLSDLAGFRIHYGTVSNSYAYAHLVDDPTATSAIISDLEEGNYFFSVTAFDHGDNESALSLEVSKEIAP